MTVLAPTARAARLALAVLAVLASGLVAAGPAGAHEEDWSSTPTPKVIQGPAASAPAASATPGKLVWSELDPGLAEAKRAGKPLLVDVYTDWCGWCKRMDRTTYADPDEARRQYLQDDAATRQLQMSVLEDQAVEWVVKAAKVTDQPASFKDIMNFGADGASDAVG